MNDIDKIETKVHVGTIKPDLEVVIYKKSQDKTTHQISLKSTFKDTQVALHPLSTFIKHIALPDTVHDFLALFSNYKHILKSNAVHPPPEQNVRKRFTLEQINIANPTLHIDTQSFLKDKAETILRFLLSTGIESSGLCADTLAFLDKKTNELMFVNIDKLIEYTISKANDESGYFCKGRHPRIPNRTTVLSLFNGLIHLQMKGSPKTSPTNYHSLQFRISGNKIKEYIIDLSS